MTVTTDLDHGGRWTSLVLGGREWLWHRDELLRDSVRPGRSFVDAGGLEECLPTVRGVPDHGDVWSRPWTAVNDITAEIRTDDFRLVRTFQGTASSVTVSYALSADPGYRFVWAAHALLDLSASAEVDIAHGTVVRLYPEAATFLDRPWPTGAPWMTSTWPECDGIPLGRLGPADGTAVGAIAVDCSAATVVDGSDRLDLRLEVEGLPASIAIWRNLGGFPEDAPYRSIGIEPMLGKVFDLAEAVAEDDAVKVPEAGFVEWKLILTAG